MSDNDKSEDGSENDADEAGIRVSEANSAFRARLKAAVDEAGGVDAVAAKSGVPRGSLYTYISTPREPKASTLARISAVVGRSMDYLMGLSNEDEASFQHQSQSSGSDDVDHIERLAFAGSAGTGSLVIEETAGTVPVPKALLQRLHLRPEHARMLESSGDSMLPTIADGDPLLLDVSSDARSYVVDNKIYAFTVGNEAFLKRLRREPGSLMMVSDNVEGFPARPVPAGEVIRIIGRVRWGAREL